MLTIQDILQKADELILEVQENSITPPRVGELIYALAELIQQGAAGGTTIGIRKLSELEDVELAGLKNLNILQLLGEKWRNVEFDIVKLNNLASLFMVDDQGRLVINDGFVSNALSHFNPGFWVGDYTPGMLGGGARLVMDNGISKLEVDQLVVRMTATFFELVISKLKHVGGQLVLSPASMKCTVVEEYPTYYRCYMDTGGGKSVNEFVLYDQARCQVFTGTGVKFYWRLVVGVGADYIDLSKTDAASGSAAPVAGDDIVQLGNRTNTARQSAQVLSTVGDDAPSYKQYAGINSYTLTGCEQTVLSPAGNKIIGDVSFRRSDGSYSTVDNAINKIQIGGRNLILNSKAGLTNSQYQVLYGDLSEEWVPGKTYTISLKGSVNAGNKFWLYRDGGAQLACWLDYDAVSALYKATFVCPDVYPGNTELKKFSIYNYPQATATAATITWIKLEKGNKATDWTPAPEDIQAEIDDARDDAATALTNYQNTVNGLLTALEDGILSDAERAGYANWLNVIARDKSEIQASYQLLYDNSRVDAANKANLLAAKNALYGADWTGGAYATLVAAINTVVTNGDNLITAAERTTLNNAFVAYNAAISTYSQRVLEAQNGITGALGGEITDAANDAATALANYQNTVNGLLNALEDGVLSDAERRSYANWLLIIAKDKAEIQASYQLLYNNTRVDAANKASLLAAKNALYGSDWTAGAYATLVAAINTVVTNGDNLITAEERTALTNAFGAYNTALGTYAQRVREAENYIITTLSADIQSAQNIADDAYSDAQYANAEIVNMGADSQLTPVEKLQTRQIWNAIVQEYSKNITQAGIYGVNTADYTTKYNALNTYLTGSGGLLTSMSVTSNITRSVYETKFNDYYVYRQELLNTIVLAAKAYSNSLINNLYVGGVNLIVGSTRTVTADAQGNGSYAIIYGAGSSSPSTTIPYLENGQKYVFSVGKIERLAGTTTNVRVLLYDFVNNTNGPYTDTLILSTSRQFLTFTVPATGYYSLLIYSGIYPNFASNSIRYSQLMLQKGEVYTQFTESLRHLTEAFEGSTEIQGGVIATNLLMMKDADSNVTAGMSGLDDNIWLWTGGNYGDAGEEEVVDLFRKDGSGFLAGKKIGWDVNGGMNIGEFKIEGSAIVGYDEDSIRRLKVHNGTLTTLSQFQTNSAEDSGFSYEIPDENFLFINDSLEDLEFEYIFKPAKGKLTIPAGTYVQFNPPILVLPDIEPTLFTARRYSRYFSIYKNGIWQQDIATFGSPVQVTSGGELDIVFNLRFYATMKAGKIKEFTLGSRPVDAGYVAINVDRARTEIAKTGIASYWATNTYLYMEKDHGFEVRFGNYILQILPVTGMRKSTNGGSTWSYL